MKINWPKFVTREVIIEKLIPQVDDEERSPKSLDKELKKTAIERIRETLKGWANAVQEAEDPDVPDRTRLFDIYNNLELDEHITALTDSILFDITQTPFHIVDRENKIDEERTKLFKKSWFYDFIRYYLEADYWGFSLIQFKPIVNGIFSGTESVNRYHIVPEKQGVSIYQYQEPNYFYNKAPYDRWTMFVKGNKHLGRYNVVAKSFILKREVVQFWAVFNELFTSPYFYAKTDINNKNHRNDLINLFTKRRHSGFAVVGLEDELDAVANSGRGWESYEKFEDSRNKAMSKAFLGQTMVFEDGSSRSQAEVHERQKDTFVQARRVVLEFAINEVLIPKMSALGIDITPEHSFNWHYAYEITPEVWAKIISMLAPYFGLDVGEIGEKIGIKLEQLTLPSVSDNKLNNYYSIAKQLKNLYNGTIHS